MTATKAGPAMWPAQVQEDDQERLERIQNDLGSELLTISSWCGERTAEGDDRSILLLTQHFQAIVHACAEARKLKNRESN